MTRKLLLLVVLMLAFPVSASPLPEKPHVYVEGSATVEVEPDMMTFSVTISKTDDVLSIAKSDVDRRSFELIELSKSLGIGNKDLATTTLRVNPSYIYKDNKRVPNGTTVSREVEITLKDLTKYAGIMAALVKAEISQTISTKLMVSNKNELTDKALVLAMQDARHRAERLAKSQNKKLGGVHSISEFMTRGEERYMLHVTRRVVGKSSSVIHADISMPSKPREPFEPGVMVAKAQVFVVYLLK